mmetsp:Transcript_4499/g.6597  ORF Transcript_4499/g.6597 Transcript_4499/m.6597 type:complete len:384 (+) Transcript_4499:17-1168(+)
MRNMLSHLSMLLLLPAGFAIGLVTERLASRNVPIIPNKLWNTLLKLSVASFVWTNLVCIDLSLNNENQCILPSSMPLLYLNKNESTDEYMVCSTTEGVEIVIILVLKCLLLYVSIRFGASLQPVGLTGGIACGKSTVSKLLRDTSTSNNKDAFAIIDVDKIGHDILVPGKMKEEDCAYHRIVAAFSGDDILEVSNASDTKGHCGSNAPAPIDRRKLGDVIFRDPAKRRKLNGITHPLISKVMMKQIVCEDFKPSSNDTSIVAVDIPLLFEVGLKMKLIFAIKVVVACSSGIQLERLINRNPDLTVEQCNKRIASQIPVHEKVEMADIVVWNNGSMDDLIKEVEVAREKILSRKHGYIGITVSWLVAFAGVLTSLACLRDIIRK